MKKKVSFFINIILILIIFTACNNTPNTKFQIPNDVNIYISSTHMSGMVKNQSDKDLLINFINTLNLVEKKVKLPNESADVYIKISNENVTINDIRFYGGGIVFDYLANMTYIIKTEKQFELFELLKRMAD